MQYFEQGLAVLRKLISEDEITKLNLNYAKNLGESCAIDEKKISISDLVVSPCSYIQLNDPSPRNEDTVQLWTDLLDKYDSEDIISYINDIEEDPHYMKDLMSVSDAAKLVGWDPFDRISTTHYKSQALIACGCGSGLILKQLIDYLKPKILTVAVTSWEEFISSFSNIDWVQIWNRYCIEDDLFISIICADESLGLLDYIAKKNSYCLDHGFIYQMPRASSETKKLAKYLSSDIVSRSLSYFGFAMDEYNMIWNSWKSLQNNPKVFSYPSERSLEGDYIICGSGASLDSAIPMLNNLQNNAIIVSCASNYGTLRKNNIEVDVLCLLERGDFMIEEYSKNALEFGTGRTKLLASCTTPYEIHSLYHDSMIYFRPSLTPTGIFCDAQYQLLPNEGPQTINTGVAFALSQYPKSITLVGVDLGCVDTSQVRSDSAIGNSPREFDKKVSGNFNEYAFTNDLLIDAKNVLESVAVACSSTSSLSKITLNNASNGININGWIPRQLEAIKTSDRNEFVKNRLDKFWSESSEYSLNHFKSAFHRSKPRKALLESINQLIMIAEKTSIENFTINSLQFIALLSLNDKDYHSSIGLRIIRGNITRLLASINRQLIISTNKSNEEKKVFVDACMRYLCKALHQLQVEIFSLFDCLEQSAI